MVPIALTIAGSDPGGGAGIQADLKTFHQLGVYGTAAVTLITIQNTTRATFVQTLDPELVAGQIDAVLEDLPPQAAKTGALGTAAVVRIVAESVARRWQGRSSDCPLVVDPVMIGKHGAPLIEAGGRAALREMLVPQATLVTPNLQEAAELAGMSIPGLDEMKEAALRIARLGAKAVLIKGGHLEGRDFESETVDVLLHNGVFTEFRARRIATRHTHGTGCTYSAAITAFLARGLAMPDAVARAKRFIDEAIRTNPGLGAGSGPVNHWADPESSSS
jgi:hydroxymethylpyrimidine/phosphomethylpyrimidine kinase